MWRTLVTVLVLASVLVVMEVACRSIKARSLPAAPAATVEPEPEPKPEPEPQPQLDEYWERTPVTQFCRNPSCSACAVKRSAMAGEGSLGDVGPFDHDDPAFI